MVRMLLAAASLAAFAIPAGAQHPADAGVVHTSPPHGHFDHRSGRGGQDAVAIWGGYDLRSSYEDRDWRPESGNDWWNDRPDRAYPRWVQEQRARGTCDPDRMWWSGSGWHC